MADHLDSPGSIPVPGGDDVAMVQSPMGAPKTDITDIYAFLKPGDRKKSILILNVNPLATLLASTFDDTGVYEINIDTDGDARADRQFRIRFSAFAGGKQTATVHAGEEDEDPIIENAPVSFGKTPVVTTQGPYRFFAGLRSDPFFFDLMGFIDELNFIYGDFFKDKDVFSIVLEVPNSTLGRMSKRTSLWARTKIRKNGSLVLDDRMGRAAINTVFNHGVDKDIFNALEPDQDLTAKNSANMTFVASFATTLTALGGSSALATVLLPDVLNYNYRKPTSYASLNGRALQDDVIDISLSLISGGKLTTDHVGPHTDYLAEFPYVGTPHGGV